MKLLCQSELLYKSLANSIERNKFDSPTSETAIPILNKPFQTAELKRMICGLLD